jgi:alpha-tubulin suppressor-like RCC1 family protein
MQPPVASPAALFGCAVLFVAILSSACTEVPFEIESTTPGPDVAGVAIQAPISVVFTGEADPATVNGTTFRIDGVEGTVSYDGATRTTTFTPASPLAKLTRYTATLAAEVKDTSGKALEAGRTWTFTTGPVIATRELHALVIKSDGTVWGWGRNADGQLGDGTQVDRTASVRVTALDGITVNALATGAAHSLAVRGDGIVLAWGENMFGQLGRGVNTPRELAAARVPDLSEVKVVAAGRFFSLALRRDGTVWGWGSNGSGELGDGTTEGRYSPVQAKGLGDIVSIAAGGDHTIALKADGTVWTWGNNAYGQIGSGDWGLEQGDSSDKKVLTPWQVPGLTGVVAIAAGLRSNLALKGDGTVWAWGGNDNALLDGSIHVAIRPSPFQRSDLGAVRMIASGYYHALAMTTGGDVSGWGSRYYSELGDGNEDLTDPNSAIALPTVGLGNVAALAAGEACSLALENDGTVKGWGNNEHGRLGLGAVEIVRTPTVIGVF